MEQLELFDDEGPCGWGSLSYFAIHYKKELTEKKTIEDNFNQLKLEFDKGLADGGAGDIKMTKKLVDMFREDENKEFFSKLKENKSLILKFCERYGVELICVQKTREEMILEPLYIFNDNLGGYTIKGIKDSL